MTLSASQSAIWATLTQLECLIEAGEDVEAGLAAAELILSIQPPPALWASVLGDPGLATLADINAYLAHDIQNPRAQEILLKALAAGRALGAEARVALEKALGAGPDAAGTEILAFISKYRLQLVKLLTAVQLAALLEGMLEVAGKLPTEGTPTEGLPVFTQAQMIEAARITAEEGAFVPPALDADDPGLPMFPMIAEAVRLLREKAPVTRERYLLLDSAAKAKAIVVAGVGSEDTLAKIRDALATNVEEGADYGTFKRKVAESVGEGTFLSESHQEMVFRTNVSGAFSDGQATVMRDPAVRAGFPYSAYHAIHDDRVRPNHLALESLGIAGSNIYRSDDPVFQLFRPPWDYNDRCSWVPLTVRHAAELGVGEAQNWLDSGVEPYPPAYVAMPSFAPPAAFRRGMDSLPLSIRLSMVPLALDEYGHDHKSKGPQGGQFVTKGTGGAKTSNNPQSKRTSNNPQSRPERKQTEALIKNAKKKSEELRSMADSMRSVPSMGSSVSKWDSEVSGLENKIKGWESELQEEETKVEEAPKTKTNSPKTLEEWAQHPSIKALGRKLDVRDVEHPVVQMHLEHLSKIPPSLAMHLGKELDGIFIGEGSLTGLDSNEYLKGVVPRGWEHTGKTFDDLAGCYDPDRKTVTAGTLLLTCKSLVLHEIGHGVDQVAPPKEPQADWKRRYASYQPDSNQERYSEMKQFRELHMDLYHSLDPYFQQEGPGGRVGCSELFAESFCHILMDREGAVAEYGDRLVKWMETNVLKGQEPAGISNVPMALDEYGHDHKSKGPQGGQFVPKGTGGAKAGDDPKTAKRQPIDTDPSAPNANKGTAQEAKKTVDSDPDPIVAPKQVDRPSISRPKTLDDWRRRYPSIEAISGALDVKDIEDFEVQKQLQALTKLPLHLAEKIGQELQGGVFMGVGTVTSLDENEHLKGVIPRGWEKTGKTWDDVSGCYDQARQVVTIGTGPGASRSRALHEIGHAIDMINPPRDLRAKLLIPHSFSPEFRELHKQLHNQLVPYLQQGGPGGIAGCEELFAESFAHILMDREDAIEEYGTKLVEWMEDNVINEKEELIAEGDEGGEGDEDELIAEEITDEEADNLNREQEMRKRLKELGGGKTVEELIDEYNT